MTLTPPQGAQSADPVREAQALVRKLANAAYNAGWLHCSDDTKTTFEYDKLLDDVLEAVRRLAAPEGPAPEPVASALMDNQGELINFHSRKRDFFGALLDDDGYIHDRDDEARADKAAAGRAPHRATLLYAAAPEAPPPVEARQPHNPWRASIENILTGDNYFRAAEWHELLADLDRLYAMPPAVKPLDDPRLQQAFGDAIEGALAFGYQQNNKPPVGHWLNRFWNIGSAEAEKASKPPIVTDEMVTAYLKANDEYWRKVDEIAPPIGVWRNGTPREATRESLRAALAAPAGAGEREALRELIAACDAQDEWRMTPTSLRMNLSAVEAYDIGNRVDLAWTAARAALSVSPPGPEIQPHLDHQVGAQGTLSDAASEAVRDIVAERRRQVEKEGWTPQHDDEHNDGSMARAAATYALYDLGVPGVAHIEGIDDKLWPWAMWWLKPKDNRSNLVRAGALIIAEVERLDRKAARAWKPCGKCTTPDYCTGVLRGCDIAESLESGIEPISGSPSPAAAPQGGDTGAPS